MSGCGALQAERRPHAADRGVRKYSFRSHRADRPVRVGRCRTQRSLDHGRNLIVVDGTRAARAGFVKQAITAILQKPAAPLANGVFMNAEFGSHGLRPGGQRVIGCLKGKMTELSPACLAALKSTE
jgi:hypothetical protein